jgi:CRISPR-associated protein (TIGR02710 family)
MIVDYGGNESMIYHATVKAIVCVVGEKTKDSIIAVLNKISPEIIYLVCGDDQLENVVMITKTLKNNIKHKLILVDYKNTEEVSQKVFVTFNYLSNRFSRDKIILDITDGNRLLCSLTVAIACIFGVKIVSAAKEDGIEIVEVSNPFQKYALLLLSQAINLYSHNSFRSAYAIFEQIKERATEINLENISEVLSMLSKAYMAWDQFVYIGKGNQEGAYNILKELSKFLNKIGKFSKYAAQLKRKVDDNLTFLRSLLESSKGYRLMSPYLILDIFLNGERRFKEGSYNEAIIRFYRCLEGCVQYRLLKYHSIDPSNPQLNRLKNEKMREYLKLIGKTTLPDKLTLYDGYILLRRILKDYFAVKLRHKDLKSLMHLRNHSILSHGINIADPETVERFMHLTSDIIKKLFKLEGMDFYDTRKNAQFIEIHEDEVLNALP